MSNNCPNLLASGVCNNSQCSFNHNILACDPCQFVALNVLEYNAHVQSRKHKRVVEGKVSQSWYCHICKRPINSNGWKEHIKGKKHKAKAKSSPSGIGAEPDIVLPTETHTFCDLCQQSIPKHLWHSHLTHRDHLRRVKYNSFRTVLDEAEKDKNGVAIEGDLDFGVIEPGIGNRGKVLSLKVSLTVPLAKISLVSVKRGVDLGPRKRKIVSPFSVAIEGNDKKLSISRSIVVKVTFAQEHIGRYQERIELKFEDHQLAKGFIISRIARAIVGDRTIHEELKARAPYVPRVRIKREPETRVTEGAKPPALNAIPYATKLPFADIPKHLLSALSASSNVTKENIASMQREFLPTTLDSETHGRHFKALLWIEEHKMEEDLQRYDMENATLSRRNQYYYLTVPGLAEKRPSVLISDKILVRKQSDPEGHWHAGHVHVVQKDQVGLVFHSSFKGWTVTQKYHIRFKLTRIPLRRQHQALGTVFTQTRVLFPNSSHLPMASIPKPHLKLVNPLISSNPPQVQAVGSILTLGPGSLPFIIFGPPGTGKTITIVEAIIQLVRKDPEIRILACAPSNSAADLIALRLSENLGKDDLFRLYAPSRDERQVPDSLRAYSYYRDNGESRPYFTVPPMAKMESYRVIVSTLISASIPSGIGMPRGHFSHIFIDEAGQATEPEAFVSIKMMADNSTNVVLSGDPKQLGPIIRSGLAIKLGLELSYIERLMSRSPYNLATGHGKSIIKLIKNFRSHEAILKFPNERFYGNDLQTCGEKEVINAFLNSPFLPNKKFPVVFHAVSGKDDRESFSPSFFNIDEAIQIKTYIQQLKADRTFKISDHEIGVITPYHAQCLKIRAVLRDITDEVKVGSVEEFQGQERKVIIISTVRSSKEFISYDIRHTLGFVANPRRFNVSVTRAKALLIVIGDPEVLGLDPLWRSFLNYIYLNKGWKGPDIPWDPSEPVDDAGGYDEAARNTALLDMNDFTRRVEAATMEVVDESIDAGVDKPWRDVE